METAPCSISKSTENAKAVKHFFFIFKFKSCFKLTNNETNYDNNNNNKEKKTSSQINMQIGGMTKYVMDQIWRPSSGCHGFTHFYPWIPEK